MVRHRLIHIETGVSIGRRKNPDASGQRSAFVSGFMQGKACAEKRRKHRWKTMVIDRMALLHDLQPSSELVQREMKSHPNAMERRILSNISEQLFHQRHKA